MPSAYRECFDYRFAVRLMVSNLIGRLPGGMAPLGIVYFLREGGVPFTTVGGFVGLYALATAAGGPVIARLVDVGGRQTPLLAASSALCAAGFLLLLATGGTRPLLTSAAIVLAGFCFPPLEASIRSLWPDVLSSERAVVAAYSLDASLQQVIFVGGPLLVAGVVAVAAPGAALALTAAAVLLGTLGYALAPPVRAWRGRPSTVSLAGPLRSRRLRHLLLSGVALGFALGCFSITSTSYAEHWGRTTLAGWLLGAHATGALVGGLVHGARSWRGRPDQQFTVTLTGLLVCYLPLLLTPPPVIMIGLMGVAGIFLSPVLTCGFRILAEVAPSGTATEAFAWLIAVIGVGTASGSTVSGWAEPAGLRAMFLLPLAAAATSAGASLLQQLGTPSSHDCDHDCDHDCEGVSAST